MQQKLWELWENKITKSSINDLIPFLILRNLQSNDDNFLFVNKIKQTTICKRKGQTFKESSQKKSGKN